MRIFCWWNKSDSPSKRIILVQGERRRTDQIADQMIRMRSPIWTFLARLILRPWSQSFNWLIWLKRLIWVFAASIRVTRLSVAGSKEAFNGLCELRKISSACSAYQHEALDLRILWCWLVYACVVPVTIGLLWFHTLKTNFNPLIPNGLFYLYLWVRPCLMERVSALASFFMIYYGNSYISCKQCRPWSDAAFCGVWSGSSLFVSIPGFYGNGFRDLFAWISPFTPLGTQSTAIIVRLRLPVTEA